MRGVGCGAIDGLVGQPLEQRERLVAVGDRQRREHRAGDGVDAHRREPEHPLDRSHADRDATACARAARTRACAAASRDG